MGSLDFSVQLVYQGTINIDVKTASVSWYLCEHIRPAGCDGGNFNIGTYADEYVKDDAGWLFRKREYHILYNDEAKGDMSGVVNPLPPLP